MLCWHIGIDKEDVFNFSYNILKRSVSPTCFGRVLRTPTLLSNEIDLCMEQIVDQLTQWSVALLISYPHVMWVFDMYSCIARSDMLTMNEWMNEIGKLTTRPCNKFSYSRNFSIAWKCCTVNPHNTQFLRVLLNVMHLITVMLLGGGL